MHQFVEIRSYTLKPGTRDQFHRLFLEKALPMLKRWSVDVVQTVRRCTIKTHTI